MWKIYLQIGSIIEKYMTYTTTYSEYVKQRALNIVLRIQ